MFDFGALPPEINSGRIYSGPGSGPMMAAAAAWDGLAAELSTAASGYGSVINELTGSQWLGPSSAVDVVRGHAIRELGQRGSRAGRGHRRTGSRGRGRVRDGIHADGAPAGDRGQPGVADDAGRDAISSGRTPRRSWPPKPSTWRCGPRMPPPCTDMRPHRPPPLSSTRIWLRPTRLARRH